MELQSNWLFLKITFCSAISEGDKEVTIRVTEDKDRNRSACNADIEESPPGNPVLDE